MPNLRETLAAKVRELAENVPNDGHLVCSGEEGFRRGWYAGAASAAQLIAESPELADIEARNAKLAEACEAAYSEYPTANGVRIFEIRKMLRAALAGEVR